jgi:hypothetical protein
MTGKGFENGHVTSMSREMAKCPMSNTTSKLFLQGTEKSNMILASCSRHHPRHQRLPHDPHRRSKPHNRQAFQRWCPQRNFYKEFLPLLGDRGQTRQSHTRRCNIRRSSKPAAATMPRCLRGLRRLRRLRHRQNHPQVGCRKHQARPQASTLRPIT